MQFSKLGEDKTEVLEKIPARLKVIRHIRPKLSCRAETPIKVLAPGNGKTRIGRIWIYLVDERPWQGTRAPAAYYRYSPDRKGERPRDHLASFHGVIQADAYSGYEALTRQVGPPGANAPRIIRAAHHTRRVLGACAQKTVR